MPEPVEPSNQNNPNNPETIQYLSGASMPAAESITARVTPTFTPSRQADEGIVRILDSVVQMMLCDQSVAVPSGETDRARDWVRTLLSHPRAREQFFQLVAERMGTIELAQLQLFSTPSDTSDGIPVAGDYPNQHLSILHEMAESGPDSYTSSELARLLLDQRALARLALLVHDLMPDWWLDTLAEAGREYGMMMAIEVEGPLSGAPRMLILGRDEMERIATIAYGDPDVPPNVWFHPAIGDTPQSIELVPAPTKSDVIFLVRFLQDGSNAELRAHAASCPDSV